MTLLSLVILRRHTGLAINAGDACRETSCECSARRAFDRRLPLGHQPAAEKEAKATCKEGGPAPSHCKCAKVDHSVRYPATGFHPLQSIRNVHMGGTSINTHSDSDRVAPQ